MHMVYILIIILFHTNEMNIIIIIIPMPLPLIFHKNSTALYFNCHLLNIRNLNNAIEYLTQSKLQITQKILNP